METRFKSRAEILEAIAQRDGFHCYLCNKHFTDKAPPTIDHYIPLSRGGDWHIDNLKLAHRICNVRKGNRIFVDGKLEPIKKRESYAARKAKKRKALDDLCGSCHNGRRLGHGERCKKCGAEPGGTLVPQYLWRRPNDCDHDNYACWLCLIDIVPRKSTLEKLLTG